MEIPDLKSMLSFSIERQSPAIIKKVIQKSATPLFQNGIHVGHAKL